MWNDNLRCSTIIERRQNYIDLAHFIVNYHPGPVSLSMIEQYQRFFDMEPFKQYQPFFQMEPNYDTKQKKICFQECVSTQQRKQRNCKRSKK